LTGDVPFRRETKTATLIAHANAPVPLPSEAIVGLPAPLDLVVLRAMEKDPAKRARSAGALMRWAQNQLVQEEAARRRVTDESPTEETISTLASPSPEAVDTAPTRSRLSSFTRTLLFHAAAYVPIWAGAYLIGRSL
jgi:hypothetical protein